MRTTAILAAHLNPHILPDAPPFERERLQTNVDHHIATQNRKNTSRTLTLSTARLDPAALEELHRGRLPRAVKIAIGSFACMPRKIRVSLEGTELSSPQLLSCTGQTGGGPTIIMHEHVFEVRLLAVVDVCAQNEGLAREARSLGPWIAKHRGGQAGQ